MKRWLIPIVALAAPLVLGAACGDDDVTNDNQNDTPLPVCGNGVMETGEQCDDGAENSDLEADACRTNCRVAICGDGILDSDEECDDAGANSDRLANACRQSCELPACGDGVIDAGEQCDDGGTAAEDGCDADCAVEPLWQCTGEPSQCACEPYRRGTACEQCVVHVDAQADAATADGRTWATAFPTVQQGVDRAHDTGAGCEVWVAAGRYHLRGEHRLATITLRDGVALLGGFAGDETDREARDPEANLTVLDGASAAAPTERVFHVITAIGTLDATVDGFVITNGRATGDAYNYDDRGGGVLAYAAGVSFERCRFEGNRASMGGGAYVFASGALRFTRCVFQDNEAERGAGLALESSNARVQDTMVVGNRVAGGDGQNLGGGVYCRDGAPVLRRVQVVGNQAWGQGALVVFPGYGGGIYSECAMSIRSSTVVGNWVSESGAGVYNSSPNLTLYNSTVAANLAQGAGGGLTYMSVTSMYYEIYVYSSIIWDNDASADPGATGSGPPFRTIVQPGYPANWDQAPWDTATDRHLTFDPQFVGGIGNPVDAGTLTDVVQDEDRGVTRLVDSGAQWDPGALVGAYVKVQSSRYNPTINFEWRPVIANDTTSLTVYVVPAVSGGDYAVHDFRLASGSPAIDAGEDHLGNAEDAFDVLGTPWTDDPAVTDTGAGSPPYVDIGAFERVP